MGLILPKLARLTCIHILSPIPFLEWLFTSRRLAPAGGFPDPPATDDAATLLSPPEALAPREPPPEEDAGCCTHAEGNRNGVCSGNVQN